MAEIADWRGGRGEERRWLRAASAANSKKLAALGIAQAASRQQRGIVARLSTILAAARTLRRVGSTAAGVSL